jgi:hypothetical protein
MMAQTSFEFRRATYVFLGDVAALKREKAPSVDFQVRFKVLERFKGVRDDELTLRFKSTSNEFRFAEGQRILLYAYKFGTEVTAGCSRTRLATAEDPEVRELRQLASGKTGSTKN